MVNLDIIQCSSLILLSHKIFYKKCYFDRADCAQSNYCQYDTSRATRSKTAYILLPLVNKIYYASSTILCTWLVIKQQRQKIDRLQDKQKVTSLVGGQN